MKISNLKVTEVLDKRIEAVKQQRKVNEDLKLFDSLSHLLHKPLRR